jgi:hypothetical protein
MKNHLPLAKNQQGDRQKNGGERMVRSHLFASPGRGGTVFAGGQNAADCA